MKLNQTSFKKGNIPWNKTSGVHINCGHCNVDMRIEPNQVGRKKFCSKKCFYKGRELKGLFEKGHANLVPPEARGHSEETKEKIKKSYHAMMKKIVGDFNWKPSERSERHKAMGSKEYKHWRKFVFERDNYTCQSCGVSNVYIEADHIKPWCIYPELRYELSNGRTLCKPCHIKQPTYGVKAIKYKELNYE
jgi:hypothetical protein